MNCSGLANGSDWAVFLWFNREHMKIFLRCSCLLLILAGWGWLFFPFHFFSPTHSCCSCWREIKKNKGCFITLSLPSNSFGMCLCFWNVECCVLGRKQDQIISTLLITGNLQYGQELKIPVTWSLKSFRKGFKGERDLLGKGLRLMVLRLHRYLVLSLTWGSAEQCWGQQQRGSLLRLGCRRGQWNGAPHSLEIS